METSSKKIVRRKAVKIVTKDYLRDRLTKPDCIKVLGRALVRIYERQTSDEQQSESTELKNSQGFTAFDARLGTLAARQFLETGSIGIKLTAYWLAQDKNGYPKICRYVRQLNEVAVERRLHETTA